MLRAMSAVLAATLFAVALPLAQTRPASTLDPAVIARVNQIYPGFTEILELCEPISLERLSRVLSENPGRDSLAVLLAVLESCPTWSASDGSGNRSLSRLGTVVRTVGELPLSPVARMLRTGTLDQRTMAAALFGGFSNLVPVGDRSALEQAFIAALSDPDMLIRELIVGRLRLLGPGPAGQAAIARSLNDPNVSSTYRWQAAGVDSGTSQLTRPERLAQLPLDELLTMSSAPDPDQRTAVAEFCRHLLTASPAKLAAADQERVLSAMIGRLRDPSPKVRSAALYTVMPLRPPRAVPALIDSLNDQNTPEYYIRSAIESLAGLGDPRALPSLERLTHASQPQHIRQAAAHAYLSIAKPADVASEVRQLLWEPPDTTLEKDVLSRGRAALPRVWEALARGSTRDRRIAAALLGWYPDVKSVRPIMTALAQSPGAVTRDQLLFDLNMILLAQGVSVAHEQRNALAGAHLRWLYGVIARGAIDANVRSVIMGQQAVTVFPDRVVAPFKIELSSGKVVASDAASPQAFQQSVSKGATGVAFHEITTVDPVARVATTLYVRLPNGGAITQLWIGLYRRDGEAWIPMQVPSHALQYGMQNQSNLLPTINRNYGADEPLKSLLLDFAMERIRVDLKESGLLQNENRLPGRSTAMDRSYVPLLERYKRSDAPSVRYTAELESTKLTGQVNVQLWIDALAQSGTPYQAMAQQVLAGYITRQITEEGQTLAGAQRDELLATLVTAEAVDPKLHPRQALLSRDVHLVRRTDRFAIIEVAFGAGTGSGSGYTMLFGRRGERWVFLCVARSWIT